MPKVTVKGKTKHFPYTPKGKAKAKAFAKKTGKKVVSKPPTKKPQGYNPPPIPPNLMPPDPSMMAPPPIPQDPTLMGAPTPPMTPPSMPMDPNAGMPPPPQGPMLPLSPSMVSSIKQSPKGKLPPALAKYWASRGRKVGM